MVSWQVRPLVVSLGKKKVGEGKFRTYLQAKVTDYFRGLLKDHKSRGNKLRKDIERADQGQTKSVYKRREKKLLKWLRAEEKAGRI